MYHLKSRIHFMRTKYCNTKLAAYSIQVPQFKSAGFGRRIFDHLLKLKSQKSTARYALLYAVIKNRFLIIIWQIIEQLLYMTVYLSIFFQLLP